MRILFILSLLVAGCFVSHAQNESLVMDNIMAAYKGDFTVTVNATYHYYPDFYKTGVSDSMRSTFVMHRDDYYFKIGSSEMMKYKDYYITSDQQSKHLEISKIASSVSSSQSPFILSDILQKRGAQISSYDPGKGLKGLSIRFSGSDIIQADLVIDENNYVRKCILKYQEEVDWVKKTIRYSKLEIIYSKPSKTNTSFPELQYGIARFIQLNKDGSFRPTTSYAHYQITDNTH